MSVFSSRKVTFCHHKEVLPLAAAAWSGGVCFEQGRKSTWCWIFTQSSHGVSLPKPGRALAVSSVQTLLSPATLSPSRKDFGRFLINKQHYVRGLLAAVRALRALTPKVSALHQPPAHAELMDAPVFCLGPGQGVANRLESRFLSCRDE